MWSQREQVEDERPTELERKAAERGRVAGVVIKASNKNVLRDGSLAIDRD